MEVALALSVLAERRGTALRELIPSTMGEPLLWAGLDALLDACAGAGVRANVTTNGTFPGRGARAWAERLVPVASDVKISWNGAAPATAEALMPGVSFASAVEGVATLVEVRDREERAGRPRCRVSFQVTAQEGNVGELAGIVRLARRLGVDRVKLNHLQPRLPSLAALSLRRDRPSVERFNRALREARAAAAEPGAARPVALENDVELRPDPSDPAPRGPCRFVGREAWVHADGRFAPCPHPAAARGELAELPAVGPGATLGDVWASAAFRAFVAEHAAHPICASCAFRRPGGA
jgi:MoaA/NifB/PqqE/SkfB family radical SAM enzyme